MKNRISIFLRLLPLLIVFQGNCGVIFKMTNAVCESRNESWVVIDTCRLRAVQRNKTILNIFLTVLHPAHVIGVRAQVLKKANGYKPWVMDVNLDACKFIKSPKNKIAKLIFDLFKDFSSVNHTCPYTGKQFLKDFYPIPNRMPVLMPTGDYVLLLTWKFNQRVQFVTNVYFTFVEDF